MKIGFFLYQIVRSTSTLIVSTYRYSQSLLLDSIFNSDFRPKLSNSRDSTTTFKEQIQTVKGVPIAKFWILTSEFGHETLTIGLVVPQNPGSDGRNYRFAHQRETGAILLF